MIFYFTGTGNSLYAAKAIAKEQGERLIPIAKEFDKPDHDFLYALKENEILGFIYPVYAWAPPKMVLDFIRRSQFTGGKPYVFSLCTCGDEEGRTSEIMKKALAERGIGLDSAFSLQMPNNYIIAFNVDSKELEKTKLERADQKLKEFNEVISNRKKGISDLIIGTHPSLKSKVVNPLFNRFAMSTKKFYAEDHCTGCKLCEQICPVHSIKVEGKPTWGKACTQCLACIHRCPVHAIQSGSRTKAKGRFVNPVFTDGSQ